MYRGYVPGASWTVSTFFLSSHMDIVILFNMDDVTYDFDGLSYLVSCCSQCVLASLLVMVICTEVINGFVLLGSIRIASA